VLEGSIITHTYIFYARGICVKTNVLCKFWRHIHDLLDYSCRLRAYMRRAIRPWHGPVARVHAAMARAGCARTYAEPSGWARMGTYTRSHGARAAARGGEPSPSPGGSQWREPDASWSFLPLRNGHRPPAMVSRAYICSDGLAQTPRRCINVDDALCEVEAAVQTV
jgi:hypothetical protein